MLGIISVLKIGQSRRRIWGLTFFFFIVLGIKCLLIKYFLKKQQQKDFWIGFGFNKRAP